MAPLYYRRHRFPPEIIQHAIWLYLRFTLSYRDVEELLAERGLDISYETVRRWVLKFGPAIARRLRQRLAMAASVLSRAARRTSSTQVAGPSERVGPRVRIRLAPAESRLRIRFTMFALRRPPRTARAWACAPMRHLPRPSEHSPEPFMAE
jgi:hypothetical protein